MPVRPLERGLAGRPTVPSGRAGPSGAHAVGGHRRRLRSPRLKAWGACHLSYYAAVVMLAASAGFELGVGILSGLGVSPGFLLFVGGLVVAAAVVAAVIVLNLPRLLIVALTAELGASLILTGILLALGRVSLEAMNAGVVGDFIRASWFWSLVFLVIGGAGIAVQLFFRQEVTPAPQQQAQPAST